VSNGSPEGKRAPGAVEHRRDIEGTVLHQAVRGRLASVLAGSADRGLPRFVDRDCARYSRGVAERPGSNLNKHVSVLERREVIPI
jgi:hypothetical protein